MTPLLVETESVGNPSITHCRISTALPILSLRLKPSLHGMLFSVQPSVHVATKSLRYTPVKGP